MHLPHYQFEREQKLKYFEYLTLRHFKNVVCIFSERVSQFLVYNLIKCVLTKIMHSKKYDFYF